MAEFCPNCRIEMGEDATFANGKKHCSVCASLFFTVNAIDFFKSAQEEYEKEKKNLDRLRPGRNYLE